MAELNIQQKDLAEVLGVPLHRVKSLTSGRVQKLTREEGEALVKKLNIRAGYLLDGQGPMFQDAEEAQLERNLSAIKRAVDKAGVAGLSHAERSALMELLAYVEMDDGPGLRRLLAGTGEEQQLLKQFRSAPRLLQEAALRALDAQGCEESGSCAKSKA